MQSQEVMFKKEDQVRDFGVYEFLRRPVFDTKNLGVFNDDGYVYITDHSTDNWKMDRFNELLGNYNLYFSIVKNTCGLKYKLCIYYRHSHDNKIRPASIFELECVISVIYEYLEYMIANNLEPGIYITGSCLTDNEDNKNIEDLNYYNSTYVQNDEDVIGEDQCNELYHRLVSIHNNKLRKAHEQEKAKAKVNNVKMVDNILDKVKNTRIYRHYHNKYVIAQHHKRKKLV